MDTVVELRTPPDQRFRWLRDATPLLDTDRLGSLAEQLRGAYAAAQPFPHTVIDNLFDPALLDEILAVFPAPDAAFWHRFRNERELKLALDREDLIPLPIRLLLYTLNGASFLNFLEQLTGIDGLIPDPRFDGGGLHQIQRGGKLSIHADFDRHNHTRLDRRLNLLLYLNKDWQPDYGGDLELWNRAMTTCVHKIPPLFNRMVIFSTSDHTYHGHPDPLTCPADRTRRSLALYYYSNGRAARKPTPGHATLFVRRPTDTFQTRWQRRLKPRLPKLLAHWLGSDAPSKPG